MNINNISALTTQGKSQLVNNIKKMDIPLKNGNTATLKVADEGIECFIKKGHQVLAQKESYPIQGLTSKRLWATYESLQKDVKEGFDFFKEFVSAILS